MRSLVDLQKSTPNFLWKDYFNNAGVKESFSDLNVGMPDFVSALNGIILNTDLSTIKDYLKWNIISGSASMLSDDF